MPARVRQSVCDTRGCCGSAPGQYRGAPPGPRPCPEWNPWAICCEARRPLHGISGPVPALLSRGLRTFSSAGQVSCSIVHPFFSPFLFLLLLPHCCGPWSAARSPYKGPAHSKPCETICARILRMAARTRDTAHGPGNHAQGLRHHVQIHARKTRTQPPLPCFSPECRLRKPVPAARRFRPGRGRHPEPPLCAGRCAAAGERDAWLIP